MADLMAGKSVVPRHPTLHEKVKFTVSVRGRQWSSARYVHETIEEFARVIQRNARRLDFIGENDKIQRLQLARTDGSEPEELDVDDTLEDVIICKGDKHLVAIIIPSKSPVPCKRSHEVAEKLHLSSTATFLHSKSNVQNASATKFPIRYGLATTAVHTVKETMSGIPSLKPVPVLFKRRVASREPSVRTLQITIPSSNPNTTPTTFLDKKDMSTYDFDCKSEACPQQNSSCFDRAIVCKHISPVAVMSSKATPSPAELAHFLVKGSSSPSNQSSATGSNMGNPFCSQYLGTATPIPGFHNFASALLRRFPMITSNPMACGSSTNDVATLAQFLAAHIRAVMPGSNPKTATSSEASQQDFPYKKNDNGNAPEDVATPSSTEATEKSDYSPTRDKPLVVEGAERPNLHGINNTRCDQSAWVSRSQEEPSFSLAHTTIITTPSNGCAKSENIQDRSELVFFINRRSKTGAGAHHLKLSDLTIYFHLSVVDAAKKLGVSQTTLKKACRKFGLKRWPGRKVRSLESTIHGLKHTIAVGQGAGMARLTEAHIRSEVTKLQEEMDRLVHGTHGQQHSPVTRTGKLCKRLYSRRWRSNYQCPSVALDLNVESQDDEQLLASGGKHRHKGTIESAVIEPNHKYSRKVGQQLGDAYSYIKENLPGCKWTPQKGQMMSKVLKNGSDNVVSLDVGLGMEIFLGGSTLEPLAETLAKGDTNHGVVEFGTPRNMFPERSPQKPKLGVN